MKENLLIILIILWFGIFLSDLLVIYQLWKIKRKAKENTNDNERYFDLKLRIHSLQLTIVFATFLIFFLGWNVKNQIIRSIKDDISVQIDSLKLSANKLKSKYDDLDSSFSNKVEEVKELAAEFNALKRNYKQLNSTLQRKLENIKTILNIYLVPNIKLDSTKEVKRFYFNKMKPLNADRLPKFIRPPYVIIQTNSGIGLRTEKITKEYIELSGTEVIVSSQFKKHNKVTLWIVPQK